MEIIKLKTQFNDDREKIICALANSGYKVWVEIEQHQQWEGGNKYYVIFEV